MDGMAVVYAAQDARRRTFVKDGEVRDREIDLSPVLEWGSLDFLLPDDRQIIYNPARVVALMRAKLARFDAARDHVLALGDPVAIGIACAVASDVSGGAFSVLKWDRQARRYHAVRVDIHQNGGGLR